MITRAPRDTLLFTTEHVALQVSAEYVLTNQEALPLSPLTLDELEVLQVLRREGRMQPDGPVCKQLPSLERAVFVNYPTVLGGIVRSECDAVCKVSIDVEATPTPFVGIGSGDSLYKKANVVADPESGYAYAAAMRAIVLPPLPQPPIRELGRVNPSSGAGKVEVTRLLLGPSFSDGFIQPPPLDCQDGEYRALIELDVEGRVIECENRTPTDSRPCNVCPAFKETMQTKGAAHRRALVELSKHSERLWDGRVMGVIGIYRRPTWIRVAGPSSPDDVDAVRQMNLGPTCVPPKRAATPADLSPDKVSAQVFVTRKEDGAIDAVRFEEKTGFKEGNEACFEAAIRSAGLPCPVPGQGELALVIETERLRN